MEAGAGTGTGPANERAHAPSWELEVAARRDALPAAQAALEAFLVTHAVAEPLRLRVAVLVEEAFMNAVMHAVAGTPDPFVLLRTRLPAGALIIELEERGLAFEADGAARRGPSCDPNSGRLGGRGLLLMQRLAQQVERERIGDINRLTLRLVRE